MIYGYARVSTKGQARDGNSLEDQTAKLEEAGVTSVFVDAYTGTKLDRPEFSKLLATLSKGDTMVVTKLDRISRSACEGISLVDSLLDRGVKVHILNMGLMDSTPTGKLIRNIMFSFAEFERDMIVERTAEGKAIARQRADYKEGRKPVVTDMTAFEKIHAKTKKGILSVREACEELGISRASWYNYCKKVG